MFPPIRHFQLQECEIVTFYESLKDMNLLAEHRSLVLVEAQDQSRIKAFIRYLQEKIVAFIQWIRRRLGMVKAKNVQSLLAMRNRILSYDGAHKMEMPVRLFKADIDFDDIEKAVNSWLEDIDELERGANDDKVLQRFPQLLTYRNNLPDLTNKIQTTIIKDSFGVPFRGTDGRISLYTMVYGSFDYVQLNTLPTATVIKRLIEFDRFLSVIDKVLKGINDRMGRVAKKYGLAEMTMSDNDIPLTLKIISALFEGILRGVTLIHSVILYGYDRMFKVASFMAHPN